MKKNYFLLLLLLLVTTAIYAQNTDPKTMPATSGAGVKPARTEPAQSPGAGLEPAQSPGAGLEPAPTTTTTAKPPMFGITFSGYVKTDIIFDSRQTVGLREGQFLLYPDVNLKDADGKDINAKANFNMMSIQTRMAVTVTGPDVFKAKSSAYVEGEFFGNINTAINSFRLRHAWVKRAWTHTDLLVGQYWHPMSSVCAHASLT